RVELVRTYVCKTQGQLLQAGDVEALSLLQRLDERPRLQQCLRSPSVQPSGPASENLDGEPSLSQVSHVDLGDFELTTRGWANLLGNVYHFIIVKIQAGDSVTRFRFLWLFLDVDWPSRLVEGDDAVR